MYRNLPSLPLADIRRKVKQIKSFGGLKLTFFFPSALSSTFIFMYYDIGIETNAFAKCFL